ncbi:MAG TPA: aminomethyl-transferring glycine dehydrogenase subunit GcvPB, partial [Dehalococcoidia bacterium]|nr:aminomethyl-transferring glycine dehydrogenase subunit GcvPB [Dehalococcoidia bacterium]
MTTAQRSKTNPRAVDIGASLTFDLSRPGRSGVLLAEADVPPAPLPDARYLRRDLNLPELSQNQVVRYFLGLSRLNYGVDTGFYPLGSCTMKYNPKVNEDVARLPGFALAHPLQPQATVQGALAALHQLQETLAAVTGMDAVSLAPAAGAQGELSGILMVKAYLEERGETGRRRVLIPDSAHGTNPATAAMCGFEVVSIPSDREGNTDMAALEAALGDGVAAMMLTLPSTLGLFDPNIERIAETLHRHGALLYGDGANQNAFLGRARFGDLGFDVVHLNLHKTFSTPHGGGGPGAGPVCAKAKLAPYLPAPIVEQADLPAHPE